MVIYIAYSATLTSYLAVFVPILPFTTEQDFLAHDASYNLTVVRGSVYHDALQVNHYFHLNSEQVDFHFNFQ